MSLIEEALRRIQDPVVSSPPPTTSPERQATPSPSPSPAPVTPHSWTATAPTRTPTTVKPSALLIVAAAIMGLTALFVIGGAVWISRTMSRTQLTTPSIAIPAFPASSTGPHASPASAAPSGWVLTGVVEGRGEPYAVINGMILGVGEELEGATVEAIANGSVTLRLANGHQMLLRVQR